MVEEPRGYRTSLGPLREDFALLENEEPLGYIQYDRSQTPQLREAQS